MTSHVIYVADFHKRFHPLTFECLHSSSSLSGKSEAELGRPVRAPCTPVCLFPVSQYVCRSGMPVFVCWLHFLLNDKSGFQHVGPPPPPPPQVLTGLYRPLCGPAMQELHIGTTVFSNPYLHGVPWVAAQHSSEFMSCVCACVCVGWGG